MRRGSIVRPAAAGFPVAGRESVRLSPVRHLRWGDPLERVAGSNPALGARFTSDSRVRIFNYGSSSLGFQLRPAGRCVAGRALVRNRMVSIVHSPPREVILTGLTGFGTQRDIASMIAFLVDLSGQRWSFYLL